MNFQDGFSILLACSILFFAVIRSLPSQNAERYERQTRELKEQNDLFP